jgi:predicted lipid carrier protein YhbT
MRHLPRVPSSAVVAAVLNLTLRHHLSRETLDRLGERVFYIDVRDAQMLMAFRCRGGRFIPVPPVEPPALTFRVDAANFTALVEPREGSPGLCLDALSVVGDPVIAAGVRKALAELDATRVRKLLARVARHVRRVHGGD